MASWRRPPAALISTRFRRMPTLNRYLRYGDLRSPTPGVTKRRNCPNGLRDDDDDDYRVSEWAQTWRQFASQKSVHTQASEAGVCRDLTPQPFMWDIDMYISPTKKLIPSHANCMQHVLKCWERQSDGTEYKKTLRRPRLRPGPR